MKGGLSVMPEFIAAREFKCRFNRMNSVTVVTPARAAKTEAFQAKVARKASRNQDKHISQ
jgi:purine nucleoside phosphorylase